MNTVSIDNSFPIPIIGYKTDNGDNALSDSFQEPLLIYWNASTIYGFNITFIKFQKFSIGLHNFIIKTPDCPMVSRREFLGRIIENQPQINKMRGDVESKMHFTYVEGWKPIIKDLTKKRIRKQRHKFLKRRIELIRMARNK